MNTRMIRCCTLFLIVIGAPVFGQTAGMLSFQGLIKDAGGNPINGSVDLEFRIFDAETLGNLVDMDGDGVVEDIIGQDAKQVLGVIATNGILSTKFGPVAPKAFDGNPRWLEVSVDGSPLSRIEMATAPATSEQVNAPATGSPVINVDDSGRVGIGGASAFADLDVHDADGSGHVLLRLVNAGGLDMTFESNPGISGVKQRIKASTTLGFDVAGLLGLAITDQGNVGIGTTTPEAKLELFGIEADQKLKVWGNGPDSGYLAAISNANNSTNTAGTLLVKANRVDDTPILDLSDALGDVKARFLANGNVGIGTTTPAANVHVRASSGEASVLLENAAGTSGLKIMDWGIKTTTNTTLSIGATNSFGGGHMNFYADGRVTLNAGTGGGNVGIGVSSPTTRLDVAGTIKTHVLEITGGADLAEPFVIAETTEGAGEILPGMVVVIDPENPGDLKLAAHAYDRKVAGVISGAKGLSPGMVMRAEGTAHADGDHPVALTGRVWCWCDATYAPIEPGDRLTTSATLGHAMKAIKNDQASGAVIGKAMTRLSEGTGLVLVLVQPQ